MNNVYNVRTIYIKTSIVECPMARTTQFLSVGLLVSEVLGLLLQIDKYIVSSLCRLSMMKMNTDTANCLLKVISMKFLNCFLGSSCLHTPHPLKLTTNHHSFDALSRVLVLDSCCIEMPEQHNKWLVTLIWNTQYFNVQHASSQQHSERRFIQASPTLHRFSCIS